MARQALTDNLWEQLQMTMKDHGCYQTQNSREVMEAILGLFAFYYAVQTQNLTSNTVKFI